MEKELTRKQTIKHELKSAAVFGSKKNSVASKRAQYLNVKA